MNSERKIVVTYRNVISIIKQTDGWTQQWAYEPFGGGLVTKLIGYIGGEGDIPTEHLGWYVGINGFVENIEEGIVHSEKGDAFFFEDFTPEEIELLQEPAIEAALVAIQAAQVARESARTADTAAQGADAAALRADNSAQSATESSGAADLATESTLRAISDAEEATSSANAATQNSIDATTEAIQATIDANSAAETANNARGWQATEEAEKHNGKELRKIVGWQGGTGIEPTTNIGLYFAIGGGFTPDKEQAVNYKGDKPIITVGLNDHWHVDGVDTGKIASSEGGMDSVYGVQFNTTHATPVLERISSNMFNHVALPVQSKMRRCLLLDDGTVNYYLNEFDSTRKVNGSPAILDGTDGQFMVEIPDLYLRASSGADLCRIEVSLHPFPGAFFYRKRYISASHATVQRSTNTMASVINDDPDFAGGGTGVNIINSVPRTSVTRANGRTYARNRGEGWELEEYTTNLIVYWLYVIEFADFHSQRAFEPERTAEGYKQGGLGNGVTTANSARLAEYSGSYPFVPIGYTASLGNHSGEKELIIPDFGGSEYIVQVPSYRGIENAFGHIFSILDGIQCLFEVGVRYEAFVTDNPDLFNDDNHDGFRYAGNMPMTNGYITAMHFGEHGDTVTKDNVGGSATTFICDYQYVPSATNEYKWYAKGGSATIGATAGLGCVTAHNRVSNTSANYGFRLCFISRA